MKIITEEMRFKKRLCEFALKYGVTKAQKGIIPIDNLYIDNLKRYNARYNNIAKKVLDFKSPNQIVEEYKLNFLSA